MVRGHDSGSIMWRKKNRVCRVRMTHTREKENRGWVIKLHFCKKIPTFIEITKMGLLKVSIIEQ